MASLVFTYKLTDNYRLKYNRKQIEQEGKGWSDQRKVRMKKNSFQLKNYVIATGIFIVAVVAGILVFFGCVQKSVQINSEKTLMTDVSRQNKHLQTILDINYQYLNEIAYAMGKSDDLFSDENKERLVSIYEKTDLERAALIDKNGKAYYDNGQTKNVSHRRYFKEAISGQETISDPLESSVDHEVRVVLGVPVYRDDKVIGVLGGSCNVTALSHMLFDDLFGGTGDSVLATSGGTVIAFDSGSASDTEITYGTNLFEYYGEKNLRGKHTLKDVRTDFLKGNSGIVRLSLKERKKADHYLAYRSLGYNDWMICYTVPVKSAQQAYDFIPGYELIFMGCFCIMVLVLLFYIVARNNREKDELFRYAQKDALTGVYNKENTQKAIDELLKEKTDSGIHGFLIIDMDHFKDVNDIYGHIMGDKVLKMFGGFLKEQFREQDVIGRIGGDEFVVLLYNIGSRENMESRIEDLCKKIRKLHIEGMEEYQFTASMGIAFAPQDGDTFMELYQKADMALYQTKKSGRDGYRIYQRVHPKTT